MDEHLPMQQAARAWVDLVEKAPLLPETQRLEALLLHLSHLYAVALRLPSAPPTPPPAEPSPWPTTWDDLPDLDEQDPPVSLLLKGICSDVSRGLNSDDAQTAVAWWRRSFDARWGTLCTATLGRLHAAVTDHRLRGRAVVHPLPTPPPSREPEVARPTRDGPLPELAPTPPTRLKTARARPEPEPPGVLGIRFQPGEHGLHITAIHPSGPAASRLEPGDILLQIDGQDLDALPESSAGALLSGVIGSPRTVIFLRDGIQLEQELIPVNPSELQRGS